jgi:hypothetical protein
MGRNRKAPTHIPSFDLISESDDDDTAVGETLKTAITPKSIRTGKAEVQPEQIVSVSLSFDVNQDEYEHKIVTPSFDESLCAMKEDTNVETKSESDLKMYDSTDTRHRTTSDTTDESQKLSFLPDNLRESLMPFQREVAHLSRGLNPKHVDSSVCYDAGSTFWIAMRWAGTYR